MTAHIFSTFLTEAAKPVKKAPGPWKSGRFAGMHKACQKIATKHGFGELRDSGHFTKDMRFFDLIKPGAVFEMYNDRISICLEPKGTLHASVYPARSGSGVWKFALKFKITDESFLEAFEKCVIEIKSAIKDKDFFEKLRPGWVHKK